MNQTRSSRNFLSMPIAYHIDRDRLHSTVMDDYSRFILAAV